MKKSIKIVFIFFSIVFAGVVAFALNYNVGTMSFSGYMINAGDTDWLDLQGQEGTNPTICLNHGPGVDFDLAVYDGSNQICSNLSMDQNSCCGSHAPGHVRVKVWSVNGSGNYTVTINPAGGKEKIHHKHHDKFPEDMPGSWTSVPGVLKQVSAAYDGSVMGITPGDDIVIWNGSGWVQVPGKLQQISIGKSNNIWGITGSHAIVKWTGSGWVQVLGIMTSVSVAYDGTVVGIAGKANIVKWNGSTWVPMPGALVQISVGKENDIWGINGSYDIFKWNGSSWSQVPGKLRQVSVAYDGTVMGIAGVNDVVIWNGSTWVPTQEKLQQVSVGSMGNAWGVDAFGNIKRKK